MKKINGYLFLPGNNIKFLKSSESMITESISRVIDLEDSVKDIFNERNSFLLKKQARLVLLDYFKENRDKFYLRLNSFESGELGFDLDFLIDLSQIIDVDSQCLGLILSKTANSIQVISLDCLIKNNFNLPIIPIVETNSGVENLFEIINLEQVNKIIFGHHDYYMDNNYFPIPESIMYSQKYRDIFDVVINVIKSSGKDLEVINGVASGLCTRDMVEDAALYVSRVASEFITGKIVLSKIQAGAINTIDMEKKIKLSNNDNISDREKKALANSLVNFYENNGLESSVKRFDTMYVSPQIYLVAKNYLNKINYE